MRPTCAMGRAVDRRSSRRLALALAPLLAFLAVRETRADQAPGPVVARLGDAGSVTAGSLSSRIAAMPWFQRLTYGRTGPVIARRFLDEVVVPAELVQIGARAAHLDGAPAVAFEVDRALSGATVRAIRARVGVPAGVSADDVRAYFEANRARYDTPERYQIARILCRTRDEALTVLAAAKADPTPKTFADLARDHSLDKGTNLRGGDVGFVTEDGVSNEPGLKVEPAVARAARGVADGEIVAQPIAEGDFFAVVWRRGTLAAHKRSADDVAAQIRDTLAKGRVKDETDKLIASLRASRVTAENPSLLDTLDLSPPPGPHGSTVDGQGPEGSN